MPEIKTLVIRVNSNDFSDTELEIPASIIKNGGTVAFPTETVYGLGADATRAECAAAIYTAKGRPSDNPLIIHISRPEDAEPYAVTSSLYYRLARHFMPGPLTVIMPRRPTIPLSVTGGLDSVAVRCPSHPVANRLIALSEVPIAAPSANISGRPSPTCADHVIHDMLGRIDCILDGGECRFGVESTIVKITGDDSLILLRPGAVTRDALLCVCSNVCVSDGVMHMLKENEQPLSPGMKYKHYAPEKPLILVSGSDFDRLCFFRDVQAKGNSIIICYDEQADSLSPDSVIRIGSVSDLETQGHRLFSALRLCDTIPGKTVYANLPPTDGFGLAIYNRLIRAAAHTVTDVSHHTNL